MDPADVDSQSHIPVVDFSDWNSPGASYERRVRVADQLVAACKSVGFVYILNHGITPQRLAEAFAWSEKLFDLSTEQKLQAPHPDGSAVHRGYSWPGLEKVSQAMGEHDPEVANKLREVTDYKVSIHSFILPFFFLMMSC